MTTNRDNGAVVESRDALASKLGETNESIRIVNADWANALQDGAFLTINVRRTRFKTVLTYEDLGLDSTNAEEEAARRRTVKLGTRYTIPKEWADKADAKDHEARRIQREMCFNTQFGWFFYAGEDGLRWKEMKAQLERVQREYMELAQTIYDSWPELQAQVRDDYRVMLQENYRRLESKGLAPATPIEQWIPERIDQMLANQRSREAVRDSFQMTWSLSMVPLAATMAEDQAKAAEILVEQAVANEFQRDRLASMRAENQRFASEFYRDIKGAVYQTVYEVTSAVLESIKSGGGLEPGSARKLRNLVAKIEDLNTGDWLNDIQLESQMQAIRSLLGRTDTTTPGLFTDRLSRIKGQAFAVLTEIERLPEERETADIAPIEAIDGGADRQVAEIEVADLVIETSDRE